jgi:2,3,4,5-tetrahydropyridine-2-carboxylate N-succinyltransferase
MDSGQKAVDLMVCTDLDEARTISSSINDENNNRKDIDRQITSEALDVVIQEKLQDKKTIVLYNPQWLKGVIGIVASRLVEHYYKPTIIFTRSNGLITGSARSVNGFNIYNAITECGDLLENYGGHMYAAGLSIKEENFDIFKKRFEEIVESRIKPDQTIQKIHVDAAISLNQITDKFFRILKQFEPFGPENMTPVFITENLYDSGFSRTVGKDGKHIKLMLTDKKGGDTLFPSIAFNQAEHYLHVSNKENFSICYSIDENTFRNKTNLQLRIKDIHFKKYESAPNREEPIKTTTMTIAEIKTKINEIWENRTKLKDPESQQLITEVINMLDAGEIRVAEQVNEEWVINEWVKKAVVLYFPMRTMETIEVGPFEFHDKIPLKHGYKEKGVRVVPHAIARHGSYVAKDVIMMPSYINIGAYVDTGTMVDTWATVGSCAQIGRNVHLSGGVGIGGVLEPLQATPVIIEDGAFIGSRCVVVEGVHIKKEAVLGANVVLTKTTKIIDVTGSEPKEFSGVIPERSVVIPGSIPKKFNAGTFNVPCALIIGKRKESTDKKTSLNEALREHNVAI